MLSLSPHYQWTDSVGQLKVGQMAFDQMTQNQPNIDVTVSIVPFIQIFLASQQRFLAVDELSGSTSI